MNVTIGGIARTVEITSFDKLGDVKVCMLTTTADGSVGFQQLNDEVRDTIYASFPVDTASGDIASFEDGADNVPVRKLMLNLVPYQGGSGDPAPDNVRPIYPANGKNLINYIRSRTSNYITFSYDSTTGGVTVSGTATANAYSDGTISASAVLSYQYLPKGTYYASLTGYDNGNTYPRLHIQAWYDDDNTSEIVVNSSRSASFTINRSAWLYTRIQVANGETVNGTVYPMVRHAEITESAYVPYNAIGITRTGKNLFDKNAIISNKWLSTTTGLLENASGYSVSDFIPVEKDHSYWLPASSSARRWFYDVDGNPKTYLANSYSIAYTPTENGYLRVTIGSDINLDTYQIEQGTSATSYEPYQGERYYPISDNPIYGGTLDVVSGVLTVNKTAIDMGSIAWTYYTGASAPMFYGDLPNGKNNNTNGGQAYIDISSCYKRSSSTVVGASTFATNGTDGSFAQNTNAQCRMLIKDNRYSTGSDFKTAVTGQTVVYELATPLVYQLTPVQVKTLLGYNNIWTDSGTVEVQYRANVGLYIQKIIGATEDDMVANQNIAANQYFFVGEELYYSTSAISAGQTIIVGTNCIKTNLADALNALNS